MDHCILVVKILKVYMMPKFSCALEHIHKMVILFLSNFKSFSLNLAFRRFWKS